MAGNTGNPSGTANCNVADSRVGPRHATMGRRNTWWDDNDHLLHRWGAYDHRLGKPRSAHRSDRRLPRSNPYRSRKRRRC